MVVGKGMAGPMIGYRDDVAHEMCTIPLMQQETGRLSKPGGLTIGSEIKDHLMHDAWSGHGNGAGKGCMRSAMNMAAGEWRVMHHQQGRLAGISC